MIKDLLVSFKDNISTKTSNPFFGTLILVWFTKNWNLLYSIFNFDSRTTLDEKRNFIMTHFTEIPFLKTLMWCVVETFILLIVSYMLINLSRLIINFFDKKVTPQVYKWTDENSIVLKSVYDISENERKRLEKRLEEEREAKLKLQDDYEKLEKRIAELITGKMSEKKETDGQNSASKKSDEKLELLYNKLKKENKIQRFEIIASSILNDIPMEKSTENIQEFTTMGLIIPGAYNTNNKYSFSLSQFGKDIHDRLLIERLK